MLQLAIENNELEYVAYFREPPLTLWGDGRTILSGLYRAFQPIGVDLTAIRVTSGGQSSADQDEVTVKTSPSSSFRFRMDRISAGLAGFGDEDLLRFAEVLDRGRTWIENAVPDVGFKSHVVLYASHSSVSGGSSRDALRALAPSIEVGGPRAESLGHGQIYHYHIPDLGWEIHLTLDHSRTVPDGIYLHLAVFMGAERLDYVEALNSIKTWLERMLASAGLAITPT